MLTLSYWQSHVCNHSHGGDSQNLNDEYLFHYLIPDIFLAGDAGTPLIHVGSTSGLDTGIPSFDIIVGISSYRKQTCQKNRRPEVFTSVSNFSLWIAQSIESSGEDVKPEPGEEDDIPLSAPQVIELLPPILMAPINPLLGSIV